MRLPSFTRVLVGAAFATLLSSASVLAGGPLPTPPDQQTGSIGGVVFRDSKFDTGVACRFGDQAVPKLQRIVVHAPSITWPDTDADNDTQHGKVGYRVTVQQSLDEGMTWSVFGRTPMVKGVADENQPAALATSVFKVKANGQRIFRAVIKVTFFRPDGSIRGTLRHWQGTYFVDGPTFDGDVSDRCFLRLPN